MVDLLFVVCCRWSLLSCVGSACGSFRAGCTLLVCVCGRCVLNVYLFVCCLVCVAAVVCLCVVRCALLFDL